MKEIFLIVIMSWGGTDITHAYRMDNIAQCEASLSKMKIKAPNGGDQEHTVAAFCAPNRGLRRYGGNDFN